jgi:UDP:flavonoid glycosyltransferase YjiC (YdhE family)
MVGRGHEVTVLGQPSMAERAERAGAAFVDFDVYGDYSPDVPIEEQLEIVLPASYGEVVGEQLVALANGWDVDAVVVDCNLAGPAAAAETLDRPSAVLFHSMYATFTDVWFGPLWPLLADLVNATRARFGRPPADGWPAVFAGHDRLLAVVPESFDAPVEPPPPNLRHFGFFVPTADADAGGAWAMPDAERDGPTVMVSLSSTYQAQEDLLARICTALSTRAVHGLVATGGRVDASALGDAPHVRCFDWLPHTEVLPHVDAVITHGGLGTCAGALSHGVPLVCIPLGRDQELNGARVAAAGAGIALAADADADQIGAALDTVLGDPAYAAAARRIADESRAAGGPLAAVADLESLL